MHRTTDEDLEVIRKMAERYGDGDIARVLTKLGRRAGKGRPGSRTAVRTARNHHGIKGRVEPRVDADVLSMQGAASYTATSTRTIKNLVDAGVLPMHQCAPYAPWGIQRSDLEGPRLRQIFETLRQTRYVRLGDKLESQAVLFPRDQPETKEL